MRPYASRPRSPMPPSLALALVAILLVVPLAPAPALAAGGAYQTGLTRWRAADAGFAAWQLNGTLLTSAGEIALDPAAAWPESDPYAPGTYYGHNYYNGGSFFAGEATSPVVTTPFGFQEAIASWNAATPGATWIETLIRARIAGRWTKWYNLGIWAADYSTVERHSVRLQGDADAFVAVDTLVLAKKKLTAEAFQVRLRLFAATAAETPAVRNTAATVSTTPGRPGTLAPGKPALWGTRLGVPECSQMVYPNGGEVWCSPTSTSMVLGYWGVQAGPCAPRVLATVAGVYDWLYDGHGNWPFNTAYAATQGMEAFVARFTSLAEAEPWIHAGVPVVVSFAWKKGQLDGAPVASSAGHLAVLAGFDAAGNPVVNDPAAPDDASVQRTYLRAQFEPLWLENSGGTVYLIFPPGTAVP